MSLLVHIHRSSEWFDSEHVPIGESEWKEYVEAQPDLVPERGTVLWSGHPDGQELELELMDGRIVVLNLDRVSRARLVAIAADLGCVLQGDDCEIYDEAGDPIEAEAFDSARSEEERPSSFADAVEAADLEVEDDDPLWNPNRATSRADFLRGFLRRD